MDKEFLKTIHGHQKIIYKVCRLYRNTRQDEEDLFQEIVYQLWKSYPSFKGEAKISSWMYRIALNTAMVVYRKKALPVTYVENVPEYLNTTGNTTSENEERLFAALQVLNDAEKAIISLYLDNFSYSEIAEITGLSETNTGVKLNRIKNKLKTILN